LDKRAETGLKQPFNFVTKTVALGLKPDDKRVAPPPLLGDATFGKAA
jgi:hypothetical protein